MVRLLTDWVKQILLGGPGVCTPVRQGVSGMLYAGRSTDTISGSNSTRLGGLR